MNNDIIQSNHAKLITAFATALVLPESAIHDELTYNNVKEWDSTAHMLLIAELENAFNVMLDTDDIIDMSSVAKARTILTKYGVQL